MDSREVRLVEQVEVLATPLEDRAHEGDVPSRWAPAGGGDHPEKGRELQDGAE